MCFVYILYSESIDQFYIGETVNIEERFAQHNSGYFDDAYTKITDDWSLVYYIECNSRIQARKIETHIKKMKSRTYLMNLIKFSEITEKLKNKYK